MAEENKIRDAADAIKGVVEAIPVYQDALQPAAKEVGTALQTIAKTLHIVLAPVSGLVWGYDKIKDFVGSAVTEKLKNIPAEQFQSPEPHVAVPVLEALRYTGYQETLQDMYANLLATSIDSETAAFAHPSFVEIIRQMSPDEALMMRLIAKSGAIPKIDVRREKRITNVGNWAIRNFSSLPQDAGCKNCNLGSNYLINLQRLGLIELREEYRLASFNNLEDLYKSLEDAPEIQSLKRQIETVIDEKMTINYGAILLTELGQQFCYACISDETHVRKNA